MSTSCWFDRFGLNTRVESHFVEHASRFGGLALWSMQAGLVVWASQPPRRAISLFAPQKSKLGLA